MDIAISKNSIPIRLTDERWEHIISNKDYMAANMIEEKNINHLLKATSHLIRLPQKHMWLDYDEDVDVLYVHFEESLSSNHSEMRDDGITLDYREKELVGLTILEASQR